MWDTWSVSLWVSSSGISSVLLLAHLLETPLVYLLEMGLDRPSDMELVSMSGKVLVLALVKRMGLD